jgi:hypothetical protein
MSSTRVVQMITAAVENVVVDVQVERQESTPHIPLTASSPSCPMPATRWTPNRTSSSSRPCFRRSLSSASSSHPNWRVRAPSGLRAHGSPPTPTLASVVLQSIYDPGTIRVWYPTADAPPPDPSVVRYVLDLPYAVWLSYSHAILLISAVHSLPSPHDDVRIRILVSLPRAYPYTAPPQLQLLSRYVGAFAVDSGLFGAVLRTYHAHLDGSGADWAPEQVCVFDGVQSVLERVSRWYAERLVTNERAREGDIAHALHDAGAEESASGPQITITQQAVPYAAPEGVEIFVAEPIVDRKSAFVGRACRISDLAQAWRDLATTIIS